jgi:hypothetical protein
LPIVMHEQLAARYCPVQLNLEERVSLADPTLRWPFL